MSSPIAITIVLVYVLWDHRYRRYIDFNIHLYFFGHLAEKKTSNWSRLQLFVQSKIGTDIKCPNTYSCRLQCAFSEMNSHISSTDKHFFYWKQLYFILVWYQKLVLLFSLKGSFQYSLIYFFIRTVLRKSGEPIIDKIIVRWTIAARIIHHVWIFRRINSRTWNCKSFLPVLFFHHFLLLCFKQVLGSTWTVEIKLIRWILTLC